MKQQPIQRKAFQFADFLNVAAGIYFSACLVGILVMLLSFGFGFLPNAALRIAFGLLSTHAVILGWSQCKKKAATMLPLLGSFGAFLFFVLLWGGIMKINEGVPNNGEGQVADQVYESAKAALGYGLPVMLPLMGITRTLIELFPEK